MSIDWRDLYAANREAIAAAGLPALPDAPAPSAGGGLATVPPAVGGVSAGLGAAPQALLERARAAALRAGGTHAPAGPRPAPGGGRSHVLHAPGGADADGPVPLVVLLHGCTQDAASFAAATGMDAAADRHRFATLHLEQGRGENPQGCWNWFLAEHQRAAGGEPAWIAAVVRETLATSPVALDPARVFVAGLSAGGAMAAILGATHPDLFAGVGVHSGLAAGAAREMPGAFAAMARGAQGATTAGPVPTIVVHGTADRTVAPVNADQVLAAALAASRAADPQAGPLDHERPDATAKGRSPGGLAWARAQWTGRDGGLLHERLLVDGLGHAWSGGTAGGSYTDPRGPSATDAMLGFFAQVARRRVSAR